MKALTLLFCLTFATVSAHALDAVWNSAADIPVTAAGYTASGESVNFTLNFAPPTGTELTVVKNTGLTLIAGAFSNLVQGQTVTLTHSGQSHEFVAHYYGGSGNDLVLVWKRNRLFSWGQNIEGQLGDGTILERVGIAPVNVSGVLAGRTVVAMGTGSLHSAALCADGTLAAWGFNGSKSLGNASSVDSSVPVAVSRTGASALAGKAVTAIAVGGGHTLALCSDGTVAAWGYNFYGQLGDNTTTSRDIPIAVSTAAGSALAGKTVIAIAVGQLHSLAACSDGTVAAWGYNTYRQLGDGTTTERRIPVAVNAAPGTSALAGKTVTALAAGSRHSLALCSDGSIAAWGSNSDGQLGYTGSFSAVPVPVNTAPGVSLLSGRTPVAITAGYWHSVALCADSTVAVWGYNASGQLGNGTFTSSSVPGAVNTGPSSALFGRTVRAVTAGVYNSAALCTDGTVAIWGINTLLQLGIPTPTLNSVLPLALLSGSPGPGEQFIGIASGSTGDHTLALAAGAPVPDIAVTGNTLPVRSGDSLPLAADGTDFGSAATGGSVARPFVIRNVGDAPLALTGTPPVTVTGLHAADFTVTQQPVAMLVPGESSTVVISFSPGGAWLRTARVNIASSDGDEANFTYDIHGTGTSTVNAAWSAATEVPFTASAFTAAGSTVSAALQFLPPTGTDLTLVNVTGLDFIGGAFSNLAHGQEIVLHSGGMAFRYVADYFGGSGNDLVLKWKASRLFSWGYNEQGQLGDNTVISQPQPVPVTASGVLAGRTVVETATGQYHCLALCSDGTLAAWGDNQYGQLGNNSTTDSRVPVVVNTAAGLSSLAGKTVVSVAAGLYFSMALCSDGTVSAWGDNTYGTLGTGSTTQRIVPAAVSTDPAISALAGKSVAAISAGIEHSIALCTDGTAVTWGRNIYGQLGNNTSGSTATRTAPLPLRTTTGSALTGRQIVSLIAGGAHNLALCSDGTLAAWGDNLYGQLGVNSTSQRNIPAAVNTASGVSAIFGKSVIALAAGDAHSLVRCSDGTLAAWGYNGNGELGINSTVNRSVPTAVNTAAGVSALAGKTVATLAGGFDFSAAHCTDGTVAAWGRSNLGQLGNSSPVSRLAPFAVLMTNLAAGEKFAGLTASGVSAHSVAPVAAPALTSLAEWRLANFGTTQNTGDAANTFDFDLDGLDNLTEFAFGLDPKNGASATIPAGAWQGGDFALSFTPPASVGGITYSAEWSSTLLPGSWTPIPDTGTPPQRVFRLAAPVPDRALVRLRVSTP